jgi:hypothetical protein
MELTWPELVNRARARGANGEFFPLVSGQETAAELRNLCLQLAGNCPCGEMHPHCPFQLLSAISFDSLQHLLATMPEVDVRELFVMELACRTEAAVGTGFLPNVARTQTARTSHRPQP